MASLALKDALAHLENSGFYLHLMYLRSDGFEFRMDGGIAQQGIEWKLRRASYVMHKETNSRRK